MKYWFGALALTVALAGPWRVALASDEIQIVHDNPGALRAVMPFTTYDTERKAVLANLPCKWVSINSSLGPSYGSHRYDFICKGGDWGTISLFLDKSDSVADGLARVRLLYRAWKSQVNPNAGEAFIAQKFLQHVSDRFVPRPIAGDVMAAFWGTRPNHWSAGNVKVVYAVDDSSQFAIHRLEIVGTASQLNQVVPMPVARPNPSVAPVVPRDAGLTRQPAPQPVPVPPQAQGVTPSPAVVVVPTTAPIAAHVPSPPALLPVAKPIVPTLPQPVEVPVPGSKPNTTGPLMVPDNAPAGAVSASLPKASPGELNTAPAPESLVKPVAPKVSATVVPGVSDTMIQNAPTNFDQFNKAMELTKDTERRAMTIGNDKTTDQDALATGDEKQAQKTASKPAVTVPEQPATPLAPVATPDVAGGVVTVEGNDYLIGKPPVRPLPQLKFVPKAEPLKDADGVIRFEDEKSKL